MKRAPLLAGLVAIALGLASCSGRVAPASTGGSESAGPVTVHFVDGNGAPIAGLSALVGGNVGTTDAQGVVSIAAAPAPFDVAFFYPDDRKATAVVYEGFTQREVTIDTSWTLGGGHLHVADVKVAARDDGLPFAGGASFTSVDGTSEATLEQDGMRFVWRGSDPVIAKVALVAYRTDAAGAPTYVAVANDTTTVAPDVSSDWAPTWRSVPANVPALVTTVSAPASARVTASLLLHGAALPSVPAAADGRVTLALPPVDAPLSLHTRAELPDGSSVTEIDDAVDPASPPVVRLPAAITAVAPDDGAKDVAVGTELRSSATGPVVTYLYPAAKNDPTNPYPVINIFSAGAAHIPDLTPLGSRSLAGATFRWDVGWTPDLTSVEQAANPPHISKPPARIVNAYSARRTLTLR